MPSENMRAQGGHHLVIVAVVASVISVFVTLATVNYFSGLQDSAPSEGMMMEMMQSMMGHKTFSDVPLKTYNDRVGRLSFVEKNGTKEFRLAAEPIRWAYAFNKSVLAWGFNGQVPGPEIRVNEGDKVHIIFTNNLPKPTTIHWHGIHVPNDQDGVPGISQKPIQPGETFTYEFVATPAGTRFYHAHGASHRDEAQQLDMGLSGAFIIEPKAKPTYDKEFVLILDEWNVMPNGMNGAMMSGEHGEGHMMGYNVFTINGETFPLIDPVDVEKGEKVLIRLINAGTSTTHPMHLHGHSFTVVAVDGNPIPKAAQLVRDTLPLAPGERYDIVVVADNPGIWYFHCHELHHAAGGMIIPFLYRGFSLSPQVFEEVFGPGMMSGSAGHSMHRN